MNDFQPLTRLRGGTDEVDGRNCYSQSYRREALRESSYMQLKGQSMVPCRREGGEEVLRQCRLKKRKRRKRYSSRVGNLKKLKKVEDFPPVNRMFLKTQEKLWDAEGLGGFVPPDVCHPHPARLYRLNSGRKIGVTHKFREMCCSTGDLQKYLGDLDAPKSIRFPFPQKIIRLRDQSAGSSQDIVLESDCLAVCQCEGGNLKPGYGSTSGTKNGKRLSKQVVTSIYLENEENTDSKMQKRLERLAKNHRQFLNISRTRKQAVKISHSNVPTACRRAPNNLSPLKNPTVKNETGSSSELFQCTPRVHRRVKKTRW